LKDKESSGRVCVTILKPDRAIWREGTSEKISDFEKHVRIEIQKSEQELTKSEMKKVVVKVIEEAKRIIFRIYIGILTNSN
jgi:RecA/RadA recombinase